MAALEVLEALSLEEEALARVLRGGREGGRGRDIVFLFLGGLLVVLFVLVDQQARNTL